MELTRSHQLALAELTKSASVLVGSVLMELSAHELDTFWKTGLTLFREVSLVTLLLTFCSPKQKLNLFCRTEMDNRGGRSRGKNEGLTQIAMFNCLGTDSATGWKHMCFVGTLIEQQL